MCYRLATLSISLLGFAVVGTAAVDRIEVKGREVFYTSRIGPYVRITGSFIGSLDPQEPIPGLLKAPRRADGRVEYSSEFTILAPEDASKGNHVMLFDVENRGHPVTSGLYNTPAGEPIKRSDMGSGFLEDSGYTIVGIHWEGGHGIHLPEYTNDAGKAVPLLPVGFAAIRDFAGFIRFDAQDKAGTPNPIAGSIQWAIASGSSQTSRVLKSVVYHGFNTINKRLVFDGLQPHTGQSGTMPYIPPPGVSAKTIDLVITGDSSVYPFTYQEIFEPAVKRGNPTPKIIATNVEGDYYRRRLSLVRTGGNGATADIPLPPSVRLWDVAGGSHGINTAPNQQNCEMPRANLDWHPLTRAALIDLTKWVVSNEEPPPTKVLALVQTDPVPYLLPAPEDYPKARLLVPARDSDGIAKGGVRLPSVAVPLQTFGGWNAPLENSCGDMSVFAYPFAKTKFERMMKNDARPSLEERYASPGDYVSKFDSVASALVKDGYMLEADAKELVAGARKASAAIPQHTDHK